MGHFSTTQGPWGCETPAWPQACHRQAANVGVNALPVAGLWQDPGARAGRTVFAITIAGTTGTTDSGCGAADGGRTRGPAGTAVLPACTGQTARRGGGLVWIRAPAAAKAPTAARGG